jgi:hypothetical protein
MTLHDILPTHVTDLSAAETYHLAAESADFLEATGHFPIDPDGYLACDDLAARIRAAAMQANPDREATMRRAAAETLGVECPA